MQVLVTSDNDLRMSWTVFFLYLFNRRLDLDGSSIPPDYTVTLLESLASICHYCLRDNTTPQTPVLSLKPRAGRSNSSPNVSVNPDSNQYSSGSGQIFTNLLHAFSVQSAPISDVPSVEVPKHILDAREGLLSVLPKILSSLFTVWSTWSPQRADSTGQRLPSEWSLNLMGSPKVGAVTPESWITAVISLQKLFTNQPTSTPYSLSNSHWGVLPSLFVQIVCYIDTNRHRR